MSFVFHKAVHPVDGLLPEVELVTIACRRSAALPYFLGAVSDDYVAQQPGAEARPEPRYARSSGVSLKQRRSEAMALAVPIPCWQRQRPSAWPRLKTAFLAGENRNVAADSECSRSVGLLRRETTPNSVDLQACEAS